MLSVLPIVERELRVASRQRSTYRSRGVTALVAAVIAGFMLIVSALAGSPRGGGGGLFQTLNWIFLLYCTFEGMRATSDSVSREKREGTLGFVLLAGMTGFQLVLGKSIALGLRAGYALLSGLPVLGLALVLGGVTLGEFWRTALGLANVLASALAAGMLASVLGRQSGSCLLTALIGLAAMIVLPYLGPVAVRLGAGTAWGVLPWFSPVHAWMLSGPGYFARPVEYWGSLFCSNALALSLLGVAGWRLRSAWLEPNRSDKSARPRRSPRKSQPLRRVDATGSGRPAGRGRGRWGWLWGESPEALLERDPAQWIQRGSGGARQVLWVAGLVYGLLLLMLAAAGFQDGAQYAIWMLNFLIGWLIRVGVATQASEWPAHARRDGAFELLLTTPLTAEEMVSGHGRAVRRAWLWPILLVALMTLVGGALAWSMGATDIPASGLLFWASGGFFGALFSLLTLGVDLVALFWVGSWFGLRSGRATHAAVRVLLWTQVLPGIFLCVPGVLFDVVFIAWARQRLLRDFRRWASTPVGTETEAGLLPLMKRVFAGRPPVVTGG